MTTEYAIAYAISGKAFRSELVQLRDRDCPLSLR